MTTLVHAQDNVTKYNIDEISYFKRLAIDHEDKKIIVNLTKIFLSLNGASGCNVRNIPNNLAGFFSYYAEVKIYQRLSILKGKLDSYQRHYDMYQQMFDRITEEFNEIKSHWDHIIIQRRGEIPNNISFDDAVKEMQKLDLVGCHNYMNYNGYSWIQWYEYLQNKFIELAHQCTAKGDSYKQTYFNWFLSFFNPVSWVNYVRHGCTRHSQVIEAYTSTVESSVRNKSNIIFLRIENINTANQAMIDFEQMITLEQVAISNPVNRVPTQMTVQNTIAFKTECDRLLTIIRDNIGFICQNMPNVIQ